MKNLSELVLSSLAAAALTLAAVAPLRAEVPRVTVSVGGMSCPFCAYGVEKKLKAVDGVRKVRVRLKAGIATVLMREGKPPALDQLRAAVTKAGFTPGEIKLTAIGTLAREGSTFVLRVRGSGQTYTVPAGPGAKAGGRLSALSAKETLVAVTGAIGAGAGPAPSLTPAKVERVFSTTLALDTKIDPAGARKLTRTLRRTRGVYRASVRVGEKRARIESLGKPLDAAALLLVVEKAGYKASVASDGDSA